MWVLSTQCGDYYFTTKEKAEEQKKKFFETRVFFEDPQEIELDQEIEFRKMWMVVICRKTGEILEAKMFEHSPHQENGVDYLDRIIMSWSDKSFQDAMKRAKRAFERIHSLGCGARK